MYIMNANNLANGIPYADTGYLYNIDTANVGPKAYPPVFPLMLAPIIAIWGISLKALKLVGVVCFVFLLLYINTKILPGKMSPVFRIIYLVIIGFYPPFFLQANDILSDIPFLLLCTISLKRIDDHTNSFSEDRPDWFQVCLTGIIIYLAYGTRSLGLLILPVILFLDLIRNRRVSLSTIIILIIAISIIVLQSVLIPETGGYFDQFPKNLQEFMLVLTNSLLYYFTLFSTIFKFGNYLIHFIVLLLLLGFVVIGILASVRKGISSYELFLLTYMVVLLFWPSYQGLRFLYPVLPILFIYILGGFQQLMLKIYQYSAWLPKTIPIILLFSFILYYFNAYIVLLPRPISDIEKSETQEIFNFVKTETDTNDVISFFNPRVLALFTGRKSVALAVPAPKGNTLTRIKELAVNYVIVRLNNSLNDQPELIQLIEENPENFRLVFENPDFRIYQFLKS